jgi:hypothetical protein
VGNTSRYITHTITRRSAFRKPAGRIPNNLDQRQFAGTVLYIRLHDACKRTARGAYGLCFGGSDYDNQYFFEIASDTTFAIGKFENGKWVDLCKWTANNALHAGEGAHNTLLAKITPGNWEFYINDVLVKTLPAQPLFGGNNGMMVEGFQTIDFDNYYFCIYQGGYGNTEFAEKFNALMVDYKNNFANSIGDSNMTETDSFGHAFEFKVKDPLPEVKEQYFFRRSTYFYIAIFGSYPTRADAVDGYLRLRDLILGGTPPCILSDAGEKHDADGVISGDVWYASDKIPGSGPYTGMIVDAQISPPTEGVSKTWDVSLQIFADNKK